MTRARLALLPAAVLLLLGAAGCGSDLHPGLAVEVGSESLTQSSADRITRDVCTSLQAQQQGSAAQSYSNATLQTSVAQTWAQRAMAGQLAEKYDVSPSAAYQQQEAQTRQQLATLDAGVRDSVLPVYTGTPYFVDILSAIGRKVLEDKGTTSPTADDSLSQGIDIAQTWLQTHPIVTSPRLPDITLGDSAFTMTDTSTSVAVSSFARQAAATQPPAAYLESLPATQVCG